MGNLQAMIDQANRRTESARKKQFVKKATDAQLLDDLARKAAEAVQAYKKVFDRIPTISGIDEFSLAMKTLKLTVDIVDRRAK